VLNIETWKEIAEYPLYEISSLGRIRNKQGKILKPFIQNCGYENMKLSLYKKHIQIHREVAKAFIPNPDNKQYVNHIDGNKLNNTVSNLEWVTNSENILHARKTGLNPYNKPTVGLKLPKRSSSDIPMSSYFGVFWDKSRNKWKACVVWNNHKYMQKRFTSELEAAQARDLCVKENNLPLPLNFN
jgi:hypothetical protein